MQTMGVRSAAMAAIILRFTVDVGLAEQRAALGVADDDVFGAGLLDHAGADFAGERAFALPVHVLRRRPPRCCCAPLRLAACTAVNGGATTTVTSLTSLTSPRSSFT